MDESHAGAFYRPELVAHATTSVERDLSMTTTKTAAKKPVVKIDPATCRGGQGRYLSPKTMKACTKPRHPGRQLCDDCEAIYRKAKKAAKPTTAKTTTAPAAKVVKVDPMEREVRAVRAMKARQAEAPQRVAAMVAPEVTVTKK